MPKGKIAIALERQVRLQDFIANATFGVSRQQIDTFMKEQFGVSKSCVDKDLNALRNKFGQKITVSSKKQRQAPLYKIQTDNGFRRKVWNILLGKHEAEE